MNKQMIKRAVVIAIVVGTLLNFINQYDAFVGDSGVELGQSPVNLLCPFLCFFV